MHIHSAQQLPPTFTPVKSSSGSATPLNDIDFSQHISINNLANMVVGSDLLGSSLRIENYDRNLNGDPYPGGRIGYDIDFAVKSPTTISRDELLDLTYGLFHDFYFNFRDEQPMFLSIHVRAYQNDVIGGCVLGAGIGHESASTYLPGQRPADLEDWFRALRSAKYYADLPGQTDSMLAYGNDPSDAANCNLSSWKR